MMMIPTNAPLMSQNDIDIAVWGICILDECMVDILVMVTMYLT